MINLTCSQCGTVLPVAEEKLGSRVFVCPKCSFPLDASTAGRPAPRPDIQATLPPDVPSPLAATRNAAAGRRWLDNVELRKEPKPPVVEPPPPVKPLPSRQRWILAGAGAVVLAAAAIAGILLLGGSKPEPTPPPVKPLEATQDSLNAISKKETKEPSPVSARKTDPESLWKDLAHADPNIRRAAAKELTSLESLPRKRYADALRTLADADVEVRQAGLGLMAKMGSPTRDDHPALAAALREDTEESRVFAARALGELGPDAIDEISFIRLLSRNDNPRISEAAEKTLRGIEKAALAIYLANLQAGAPNARREAALSLGEMGVEAKAALPNLVEALSDKNSAVRVAASEALVLIGPDALPVLIEALKDRDANVRRAALAALGRMGPDARESIPELIVQAAAGPHKQEATAILAKIGAYAIPTLVAALQRERDPARQQALTDALILIGGDALPALAKVEKKEQNVARVVEKFAEAKIELPRVKEPTGRAGLIMAELRLLFKKGDANGDGYLDKQELARMIRGAQAKPYDHSPDPNKPRVLTPKDFERYPDFAFLSRLDRDEDGKISRREYELWAADYASYLAQAQEYQQKIMNAELKLRQKLGSAAISSQLRQDWAAYSTLRRQNGHLGHLEWMQRELMRRLPGHKAHF